MTAYSFTLYVVKILRPIKLQHSVVNSVSPCIFFLNLFFPLLNEISFRDLPATDRIIESACS